MNVKLQGRHIMPIMFMVGNCVGVLLVMAQVVTTIMVHQNAVHVMEQAKNDIKQESTAMKWESNTFNKVLLNNEQEYIDLVMSLKDMFPCVERFDLEG